MTIKGLGERHKTTDGGKGYRRTISTGWIPEEAAIRAEAKRTGRCSVCLQSLPSWTTPSKEKPYCLSLRKSCANIYYERYYRSWAIAKRATIRRTNGVCEGGCGTTADPKLVEFALAQLSPRLPGFDFDHIVEVSTGGDSFDPANVQLLCKGCHKAKTKAFLSKPNSLSENIRTGRQKLLEYPRIW